MSLVWSGLASPLLYASTFDRRRSRIKTHVYIHRVQAGPNEYGSLG